MAFKYDADEFRQVARAVKRFNRYLAFAPEWTEDSLVQVMLGIMHRHMEESTVCGMGGWRLAAWDDRYQPGVRCVQASVNPSILRDVLFDSEGG